MKTPEDLDTKCIDIFLRFATNMCIMPINRAMVMAIGRQHEAKSSMKIWKQIELFDDGRRFSLRMEPR
jgi:hypothetical protein